MKIATLYISVIFLLSFGNNWFNLLNQAREYYISGNYNEAWELYNKIDRPQIENQIETEKAQAAFRAEKYNQAIQLYRAAINYTESKQVEAIIYYNLAICYTQVNNEEAAIECYKESIRKYPTKSAKHNFLLLKSKMKQAEKGEMASGEQSPIDLEQLQPLNLDNSIDLNEPTTSLHELIVEKQLDELERLDAMTKKKAFRKFDTKQVNSTQKDW